MPRWAGEQPLTAGKHTIVFDFTYDGPGIAKGGTGVLKVDGQDVATPEDPEDDPVPDAGRRDLRRRRRYAHRGERPRLQVPFRFNGTIDKLTFKLGPTQLTENEERMIQEAYAIAND